MDTRQSDTRQPDTPQLDIQQPDTQWLDTYLPSCFVLMATHFCSQQTIRALGKISPCLQQSRALDYSSVQPGPELQQAFTL